jgi:hypothetical protein
VRIPAIVPEAGIIRICHLVIDDPAEDPIQSMPVFIIAFASVQKESECIAVPGRALRHVVAAPVLILWRERQPADEPHIFVIKLVTQGLGE